MKPHPKAVASHLNWLYYSPNRGPDYVRALLPKLGDESINALLLGKGTEEDLTYAHEVLRVRFEPD